MMRKITNVLDMCSKKENVKLFIPDLKKGRALKAKKGTTFKKQGTPSPLPIKASKRGHYVFKTFF